MDASNASRWQPQEVRAPSPRRPLPASRAPRARQSEDELREFIHQTVELASTLLEQTAALKKKAGGCKTFSPYV